MQSPNLRDQMHLTIKFAGDSGDGIQVSGGRLAAMSADKGYFVVTLAQYPAEIRAPVGTLHGVSNFQIKMSADHIFTASDDIDILVAMNPASLQLNLKELRERATVIVNSDAFTEQNFAKIHVHRDDFEKTLESKYQVIKIPINRLTKEALSDLSLKSNQVDKCKNFWTLGFISRFLDVELQTARSWIEEKFSKDAKIVSANLAALNAGYSYGEMNEFIPETSYFGAAVSKDPDAKIGMRFISGNRALALGIATAASLAKRAAVYAGYPITPASDVFTEILRLGDTPVMPIQAEDEIAAVGMALGAAYGGRIGVTASSGPGFSLMTEFLNLAVMSELPLVVIDVQRAGPSTGMPTKTEQADLLQALWGRSGEAPLAVIAPQSPDDCFAIMLEAVRIAIKHMTPVVVLSDCYLAHTSESWRIPEIKDLQDVAIQQPNECVANYMDGTVRTFSPYLRNAVGARDWIAPGQIGHEHVIGGLEKENITGKVSFDPENHAVMTDLRRQKIQNIAHTYAPLNVLENVSSPTLVLSWGSTYGVIKECLATLTRRGSSLAHLHLRHLYPLPADLRGLLNNYKNIIIPENNAGQLARYIRSEYGLSNIHSLASIDGRPWHPRVLTDLMVSALEKNER